MKRLAVSTAVAAFFVLAIAGTLCRVPPFLCGMRAMAGGAVLYVLAAALGRLVVWMLAQSVLAARGSWKGKTSDTPH